MAIVNTKESSIAREAGKVIYIEAGPEIAVATTKANTAQLAVLSILALKATAEHNPSFQYRRLWNLSSFAYGAAEGVRG